MKWTSPPIIKIEEALGAIADKRININGLEAKVYSSSGQKYYKVNYDSNNNSIMSNDNGSYYIGYLGYPSIAYLMMIGQLDFSEKFAEALKGIHWKNINQMNENNFEKTQEYIDNLIQEKGIDLNSFKKYLEKISEEIRNKDLNILGEKVLPPKGY